MAVRSRDTMSPANAAPSRPEPDFAVLGPATRLAIRTGLRACDDAIAEHEAKLAMPWLSAIERRHYESELRGWVAARDKILTQSYPPPYKPGQSKHVAPADDDGRNDAA